MKQVFLAFLCLVFLGSTSNTANAQQVLSSAHEMYFGMGSSTLSSSTKATLDNLITRLKRGGTYTEILVYGYASPEGSNEYNMRLSEKRIMEVYNYFLKQGVPEDKVRFRVPRGEEMYRSLYYKGENIPKGDKARFVEVLITPKIDQVDPSGAPNSVKGDDKTSDQ